MSDRTDEEGHTIPTINFVSSSPESSGLQNTEGGVESSLDTSESMRDWIYEEEDDEPSSPITFAVDETAPRLSVHIKGFDEVHETSDAPSSLVNERTDDFPPDVIDSLAEVGSIPDIISNIEDNGDERRGSGFQEENVPHVDLPPLVFTEHVDIDMLGTEVTDHGENDEFQATEQDYVLTIRGGKANVLKRFLRRNYWSVYHPIRNTLWLNTCICLHKAKGNVYGELEKDLFQRGHLTDIPVPGFLDENLGFRPFLLSVAGEEHANKIMSVIEHTNPDIMFCPTMYPIVCLMLHYLCPSDIFKCIDSILRKDYFLIQTRVAHDASKRVMRDLTKKYAKSVFVSLVRQTSNIDVIFENWMLWIYRDLPFQFLTKIHDCFLCEGLKVLYRIGLAILILYTKYSGKRSSPEPQTFYIGKSIQRFCCNFPYNAEKLLKTAFGIRGLTRKEIRKLHAKHETYISSQTHLVADLRLSPSVMSLGGRSKSVGGPMVIKPVASTVIRKEKMYVIWTWLPQRYAVCQPELLFTSEEHGTSLQTMYSKIEDHNPTLFVIKTTKNEVFGAFCSAPWCERRLSTKNLSYFGTGETFIYTLVPDTVKYEWVGIDNPNIPKTANMFLAGDSSALTIGGGGGQAIQIHDNFVHCRTESCDTFDNLPLCDSEDFECCDPSLERARCTQTFSDSINCASKVTEHSLTASIVGLILPQRTVLSGEDVKLLTAVPGETHPVQAKDPYVVFDKSEAMKLPPRRPYHISVPWGQGEALIYVARTCSPILVK